MSINQVLSALLPGIGWTITGRDLSTLVLPVGVTAPTQSQVDAYIAANAYKAARAAEYPPLTALADAVVHQQNGDPTAMNAYIAACDAVKAKYPKPS